jgi:hypothetical protein
MRSYLCYASEHFNTLLMISALQHKLNVQSCYKDNLVAIVTVVPLGV